MLLNQWQNQGRETGGKPPPPPKKKHFFGPATELKNECVCVAQATMTIYLKLARFNILKYSQNKPKRNGKSIFEN